jgi:hypothetical protein
MHTMKQNRNHQNQIKSVRTIFVAAVAVLAFLVAVLAFSAKNTKAEETTLNKYYTSYEVQGGDTLWEIAKEYAKDDSGHAIRAYVDEVCAINHLPSETIYTGREICIPYYSAEQR